MSRIGKKPIVIPQGVKIKINDQEVKITGPKGELVLNLSPVLKAELKNQQLIVVPVKQTKKTSALWGTFRALLANMIVGVSQGYQKQLEIEGVGYTASLENKDLILKLGLSHSVKVQAPPNIEFKVEKNVITVSGVDKALVGQMAANVRSQKKPEPYKGKGIHYRGEVIRRKAGKKIVGTTK